MTKKSALAVGLALVLGLAAYELGRCREQLNSKTAAQASSEQDPAAGPIDNATTSSSDPTGGEVHDGAGAGPVLDKKRREEMRQAIYRAWGITAPQPDYAGTTPPAKPAIPEERPFDKDYVRSRIREDYIPLAKDCYEQGLKKNPKLEGKLTASFRIVGNKNVGGIIDWVDTSEGTTIDSQGESAGVPSARRPLGDKDVVECLKQSLYSVSFQAPPNDGVVTVTYPLTFAPDPPDGATSD